MITKLVTCSHCESTNLVQNGFTKNQKQRYFCHDCQRRSREAPQPHGDTAEQRAEILRAYFFARLDAHVWRGAQYGDAVVAGKKTTLSELTTTLVVPPEPPLLEVDEGWSFVLKKANQYCLVPPDPTSRGGCHGRPPRRHLSTTGGAHSGGVSCRTLLHGLWGSVAESLARRAAHAGRQRDRANGPRRALEQYLATTAGALGAQDPVLFQVGGEARALFATLFASLQSLACLPRLSRYPRGYGFILSMK